MDEPTLEVDGDFSLEAYERARLEWLAEFRPDAPAEPLHSWHVTLPRGRNFMLERLTDDEVFGGCRYQPECHAFGSLADVVAVVASETDGLWRAELMASIEREKSWIGMSPRWELELRLGDGEMFHISRASNRASIQRYGLDWRRMAGRGIAGSVKPELDGIFVCESLEDCWFFVRMPDEPVDVWAVDVTGRWVESGPDGWYVLEEAVPSERLRLAWPDVDLDFEIA